MKKILFTLGLWCCLLTASMAQIGFASTTLEGCDTLTNTPIRILSVGDIQDCCYEWNGEDWVKRPDNGNCDNVVPGTCTGCKQTSECYGGRSRAVSATLTDGTVIPVQDLLIDGIPNGVNDLAETLTSLYGGSYSTSTGEEDGLCGVGSTLDAFIFTNLAVQIDYITLSSGVIDVQQRGQCNFNYTCADCNTCARTCYIAGVEDRTYFELLLGMGGGATQLDILACLGTSSANFTFQQTQIRDCIATLTKADFVSVERLNDLFFEIRICGIPEGSLQPLWIGGERENTRFNQAQEEEKGETIHLDRCTVEEIKPKPPFSTVTLKACVKGVQVNVIIGLDSEGDRLWYKDEDGNTIDNPDFQADCPPLTCENQVQQLCAGQDDASLGITQGDQLLVTFKICSDGSTDIVTASTLSNPTAPITLPSGFTFEDCAGGNDIVLLGCKVDEDRTRWNELLANGTTIIYQNQSDNSFGTPNGTLTPCDDPKTIVGQAHDTYCAKVGEVEYKVFLILNADGTHSAKPIGGGQIFDEGDYMLISCCPATDVETLHFDGFTVTRPADTPNLNWDNEETTGSLPLIGDFELCFKIESATPNTPQMFGITADPNANANFNTIDHAIYFYNAGTSYLLREYRNGGFAASFNNTSWVGTEICFERIGADLYYKQNGIELNPTAPCPVGTGTVYLDDSHYYRPGFWESGSITYSDFVLRQAGDDDIKSVAECCCEAFVDGGGNVSADFGASFPISASAGDRFYNTTLREEFRFDAALGRWTGEVRTDGFGDNGSASSNQQLRRYNGMLSGTDRGIFFNYDILVTDVHFNWETPDLSNGSVQLKSGAGIVHSLGWAGADEASASNLSVIIPANTVINAELGTLSASLNNSQYIFTYRRLE